MDHVPERLHAALEGRYRIVRQVGEGGMATVYLAHDLRHERNVALKVLKPELAAVVGADRFLAEIRTTANLQHPHILPLFDSGEAAGFLFYVMPYVEGESLRELLDREHQLSVDEAVRIATNVAEALDYAHRHGVIHRDIKPANILLQDGKPVVSDFGIALAVTYGGAGRLTETGLSLGTPHYMSPEQATGDQSVHAATDIYALGCVLYEMLVGEPPYTGSTAQAILGKIIQSHPVSATEARRSVPPHVDAVIRKALEKLAADRFAHARDFAAALSDVGFQHGAPEEARAARWSTASMAAVAGLASVITGAVVWTVGPGRTMEPEGPIRFTVDLPGSGALRENTVQTIALTRDGRALVVNVMLDSTGAAASQLFLRELASLEAVPIRGTENVGSFFLSPDGQWVAFYDARDGALARLPIGGGPPTTISETGLVGLGFQGASWGEGGRIVFTTSANRGLMTVPDVGGSPEPLLVIDEGSDEAYWAPHFLPGGAHLLFDIRRTGQPPVIALLDVAAGEYDSLTVGLYPQYVEPGYVVFSRPQAGLWAARLDARRRAIVGDPVPIVESAGPFSVTPGGTLASVPSSDQAGATRTLVWVERSGEETAMPIDPRPYVYPRISHTGDRLAVAVAQDVVVTQSPADLWVLDLGRYALTRITFGGNQRFYPIWTPDGRRLTHADGTGAENSLVLSSADGVSGSDTLFALGARRFPGSWSPDGRTLAYYVGPDGTPTNSRDLWTLRMDGGEPTPAPFLATPFEDRAPAFSPDGRWIAYVSNKSGRDEVYVVPYPGPGPEFTVSTSGGIEPVWSREGTELFYRTDDQLMVVEVQLGEAFRAAQPRALFPDPYERDVAGVRGNPNYDVAPDGERFVMVRRNAVGRTAVTLVTGWAGELSQRLPN